MALVHPIVTRAFILCRVHSLNYANINVYASGDSNAGNRKRRDNSELVLCDWEKFGLGNPAVYQAPLIKGMGTKQIFLDLAECHCQLTWHKSFNGLSREVVIVKAWIVPDVILPINEQKKTEFPSYLNWYKEHLLTWLNNVVKMM
ncbi:hypothetical protein DK080_22280 [Salmonella enterica subsp. enterica serovar Poona]|nr:hypothetical protein [Salmonella enterica subsp. enterica serovar Poona]ECA2557900.1 hypothetical protein [Salmonella enterica subsp. enterica serovar Poona]